MKTLITLSIAAVIAAVGAIVFARSGLYDVSASSAHSKPVGWLLSTTSRASIERQLPATDLLYGNEAEKGKEFGTAERGVLQRALSRANGNASAAAKMLGISRATLYRKLKRLDLSRRH